MSTVPFGAAIALNNVQNGKIENNTCTASIRGIYIYGASMYNTIVNNTANTVQQGIALYFSDNNTIVNNSANSNTYGIYLYYPTTTNDVGGNYWYDNSVKEGNYWSNWDSKDNGTANAYPIDGGAGASDWYPLGGPVDEGSQLAVVPFLTIFLFALSMIVRRAQK
ncbi:MAG: right-handed parallel beta-helix repeat-containing protein [Thermoplasmata archaeon]